MNERSEQFRKWAAERMQTKVYRRVERRLTIRFWFYDLFHRGRQGRDI